MGKIIGQLQLGRILKIIGQITNNTIRQNSKIIRQSSLTIGQSSLTIRQIYIHNWANTPDITRQVL